MIVLALAVTLKVSMRIETLLLNLLLLMLLLSILMMILCLILILHDSLYCRVLSIYHVLSDMPNFFVKYSFTRNQVVYRKTAIVRASTPVAAMDKVIDYYVANLGTVESFVFERISISSYNLVIK